jgi:hypothetical protein
MQNTAAMVGFYRSLGLPVKEHAAVVRVFMGDQMINFHLPEFWLGDSPLRAPAARPPCGDLCFVWQGTEESLAGLLHRAGAVVIEGPVAREAGRGTVGSSVCVRDPDGNLLDFMTYPDDPKEHAHAG